jgi:hypothetical protein
MTDPGQLFRNDTSQKERAEVLKNDRAVQKNTFLSHTHSDEGGRFAKPQTVIGETPTVQYPMAAPNWSSDPTGVEPSLGFSVEDHEPVGEPGEVRASLEALGDHSGLREGGLPVHSLLRQGSTLNLKWSHAKSIS